MNLRVKLIYPYYLLKQLLKVHFIKVHGFFQAGEPILILSFQKYCQKIQPTNIPPYYFYDIQSHVFSDITSKDRVSLSYYSGIDDIIFDTFGLDGRWGNNTISGHYRRVFNERLVETFCLLIVDSLLNLDLEGIMDWLVLMKLMILLYLVTFHGLSLQIQL